MRVLLLGSHLGYNLEHYVKMALERLGCEVRFVGYRKFLGPLATPVRIVISRSKTARRFTGAFALRKFNNVTKHVGFEFEPELVLSIKGESVHSSTIRWLSQRLGTITALWYPDDPRYFDSLSKLIAPHYDFVFTSSKKFVSEYRDAGVDQVECLPFACEPSVHRPVILSQHEMETLACDICFVGTFSKKRGRVVQALEEGGFRVNVWGPYWRFFKRGRNVNGPAFGHDLVKIFNAAKIVLNIHDDNDLDFKPNMRVFEAAGCRSLLLSDRAFGLEEFFTPNEEIVCYYDEADLLKLANCYIQWSTEGAAIAAKGHERAYRDHTYDQRIGTILKVVS